MFIAPCYTPVSLISGVIPKREFCLRHSVGSPHESCIRGLSANHNRFMRIRLGSSNVSGQPVSRLKGGTFNKWTTLNTWTPYWSSRERTEGASSRSLSPVTKYVIGCQTHAGAFHASGGRRTTSPNRLLWHLAGLRAPPDVIARRAIPLGHEHWPPECGSLPHRCIG